eukprot:TRINITY_DN2067_c0_g1_i6.p1 TRINITY_DN2067_c0_g1~~TRINITY_DN2067_c0_g1_i6.p1  ORF type:complete len:843 (-),score=96.27 TRINITY_DN2067_c0_g1_i6:852-3380(-)
MVKFTMDQLRNLMDKQQNIRNMSVIAHVDHGKSTLTDSLVAAAGMISVEKAGDQRTMDTRKDEQELGITIKSTGISLYYSMDEEKLKGMPQSRDGNEYLINLIDSPGHVDFSSEVTAALRITDGALVVVDCVEGVSVQTETVLRQALTERIKPVLTVNKLDRCFLELQLDGEEAYGLFKRAIEDANVIISTFQDEVMGDLQVYPQKGTVSFSAGLHGWAFTIPMFAKMYAAKTSTPADRWIERLWGDKFLSMDGKWSSKNNEGSRRGFCKFIYDPISSLISACMNDETEKAMAMCDKLGISDLLKPEDKKLTGKHLMKRVMQTWLPAHEALLEMMIHHLPSPATAQKYRVDTLYEGPLDDQYAAAMRNCDPEGPLMMYVSKMIPTSGKSRFFAFGRVFSGTIGTGQKVRIMGPNYIPGEKKDLYTKSVQRTVLCMGRRQEPVDDVPCGNTVALVGLDQYIQKNATLTNEKNVDAHSIKAMKFSVSPVVRVAVQPKAAADLPKLVEAIKRLSQSDPMVQCTVEENGDHIIAGAGELHLRICLNDLQQDYMGGAEIVVSEPVVSYRETVTKTSDHVVMAKSTNKHNRIFIQGKPLDDQLTIAIEEGNISPSDDVKERGKKLVDNFGWDKDLSKKIWCFGPETTGPNLLVDATKAVQYLNLVKDTCVAAFQWASKQGVLAEENMRGCHFEIMDALLHSDPMHRGGGQLIPGMRRVLYAAELSSGPRLSEPVFLVEIQCPQQAVSGIYSVVSLKRGNVFEEVPRLGTPLVSVRCYLPVAESFGFTEELRAATAGQAFPTMTFDHWDVMSDDPLQQGSRANVIIESIRKRKGLKPQPSPLSEYEDKL